MSKFSVIPLLGAHLNTLRDARTGRPRVADYLQLYGLPVVVGAALAVNRFQLPGVGELLAGIAILGSLLFGLVLCVIQLRLQMTSDPRVGERAIRLVDELFANVAYAVLVGLITTALTMAAAASRTTNRDGDLNPLATGWTGVVVTLTAHLLLLIGMSLKRTQAVYAQLTKQRPASIASLRDERVRRDGDLL